MPALQPATRSPLNRPPTSQLFHQTFGGACGGDRMDPHINIDRPASLAIIFVHPPATRIGPHTTYTTPREGSCGFSPRWVGLTGTLPSYLTTTHIDNVALYACHVLNMGHSILTGEYSATVPLLYKTESSCIARNIFATTSVQVRPLQMPEVRAHSFNVRFRDLPSHIDGTTDPTLALSRGS